MFPEHLAKQKEDEVIKNKIMEDCLVIGCDFSSEEDHICLTVVRKTKTGDRVLNQFYDEEAKNIYNKLTEINNEV